MYFIFFIVRLLTFNRYNLLILFNLFNNDFLLYLDQKFCFGTILKYLKKIFFNIFFRYLIALSQSIKYFFNTKFFFFIFFLKTFFFFFYFFNSEFEFVFFKKTILFISVFLLKD